jgi:transcriptional regulator with XRE-family HTH domain
MGIYLQKINQRRRDLGMTYEVVARRSGLSLATIYRTLTDQQPDVSLATVSAMAEAVGLRFVLEQSNSVSDLLEAQATRRAEKLTSMVQGTSGLEGQALSQQRLDEMTRQTVHQLLAGSKRQLWRE